MKPRRGEGVILYSRTATHGADNWFVVELAGGDVRYTCVTSSLVRRHIPLRDVIAGATSDTPA